MDDLLQFLLREPGQVVAAESLVEFWSRTRNLRSRFPVPIERAMAGGRAADRVGFAFACGYEAALHALVPTLPAEAIGGFSVTEEGGNHPRAIQARLERSEGAAFLTGKKRWSTMGPLSDVLVVVATTGNSSPGPEGRPVLVAVLVEKGARGLTVTEMPPPPFVPEVPHAELAFDRVAIAETAILPGDGYADYVKPFRTVEDLHVNAAMLGYLLSVAARNGWPDVLVQKLVASTAAARAVSALDPRRPETHVALAGLLDQVADIVAEAEPSWPLASDAERERWYRDRVLTQVASKARQQRRERAFAVLHGENPK